MRLNLSSAGSTCGETGVSSYNDWMCWNRLDLDAIYVRSQCLNRGLFLRCRKWTHHVQPSLASEFNTKWLRPGKWQCVVSLWEETRLRTEESRPKDDREKEQPRDRLSNISGSCTRLRTSNDSLFTRQVAQFLILHSTCPPIGSGTKESLGRIEDWRDTGEVERTMSITETERGGNTTMEFAHRGAERSVQPLIIRIFFRATKIHMDQPTIRPSTTTTKATTQQMQNLRILLRTKTIVLSVTVIPFSHAKGMWRVSLVHT